ncbi:phage antirepressor KilAC domain-containing protein [Streptomyces sp. NPDC091267]|uniref:phage antirepressor KilAC domain-containing protein n=1 Tax=Streptomyces sp. NPDC091267 TaxID=3155195 RepID=UPI003426881B
MAEQYVAAATELVAAKKGLAVAAPKAGKGHAFGDSEGLIGMATAAKALTVTTGGLGRTKFMDRLREDDLHFLQVQNPRLPFEAHIQAGRAEVKLDQANYQWVEQTFFTPKGVDWLVGKLSRGAVLPAV